MKLKRMADMNRHPVRQLCGCLLGLALVMVLAAKIERGAWEPYDAVGVLGVSVLIWKCFQR